jgi:hypothetical protein
VVFSDPFLWVKQIKEQFPDLYKAGNLKKPEPLVTSLLEKYNNHKDDYMWKKGYRYYYHKISNSDNHSNILLWRAIEISRY